MRCEKVFEAGIACESPSVLSNRSNPRGSHFDVSARLTKVISKIDSVVKWKLCHHEELETWTKVSALLVVLSVTR